MDARVLGKSCSLHVFIAFFFLVIKTFDAICDSLFKDVVEIFAGHRLGRVFVTPHGRKLFLLQTLGCVVDALFLFIVHKTVCVPLLQRRIAHSWRLHHLLIFKIFGVSNVVRCNMHIFQQARQLAGGLQSLLL